MNEKKSVNHGNEWEEAGDALLYTRRNHEDVVRWRAEAAQIASVSVQSEVQTQHIPTE